MQAVDHSLFSFINNSEKGSVVEEEKQEASETFSNPSNIMHYRWRNRLKKKLHRIDLNDLNA